VRHRDRRGGAWLLAIIIGASPALANIPSDAAQALRQQLPLSGSGRTVDTVCDYEFASAPSRPCSSGCWILGGASSETVLRTVQKADGSPVVSRKSAEHLAKLAGLPTSQVQKPSSGNGLLAEGVAQACLAAEPDSLVQVSVAADGKLHACDPNVYLPFARSGSMADSPYYGRRWTLKQRGGAVQWSGASSCCGRRV